MRVAFINHVPIERLNVGLAYMVTAVGRSHQVRLYDITFREQGFEGYLRRELTREPPHFICFSVNSFSMKSALRWAELCRRICPTALTVFGGVHPTLMPEEVIRHPLVDCICIGEGEEALVELLAACRTDPWSVVPGIWRKDASGRILRAPRRPFIEDLDALPVVDWSYWDMEAYLCFGGMFRGGLRVLASRGCPCNCAFCSVNAIRGAVPGRYYRCRSAASVVDEMELMYRRYRPLGARYINFADATFGHDRRQLEELVREMERRGLDREIPWTCSTHPRVISERWASLCRQAGCFQVLVGIESADARIRQQVLGKQVTDEQIERAITSLKRAGILIATNFMLCAPTETWHSLLKNMLMIIRIDVMRTMLCYYFPLPHSELARRSAAYPWSNNEFPSDVFSKPHPLLNGCSPTLRYASRALVGLHKAAGYLRRGVALRGPRFFTDVTRYLVTEAVRVGRRRSKGKLLPTLWLHTVAEYEFERAQRP